MGHKKNIISVVTALLPFLLLGLFVYTQNVTRAGGACELGEDAFHITTSK